MHGWEIDGAVSIEKTELEFGLGKQGQYIIKSFIPVVSERIRKEIDMSVSIAQKDIKGDKKGFMIIQLYPEPKIEIQKENDIRFSGQGLNLLFTAEGSQLLARAFLDSSKKQMSLKKISALKESAFEKQKCSFDIKTSKLSIIIDTDFLAQEFRIKINGQDCFNVRIDRSVFAENRQGVLIYGNNASDLTLTATVDSVKIFKKVTENIQSKKSFFNDVNILTTELDVSQIEQNSQVTIPHILIKQKENEQLIKQIQQSL